MSSGNREQQPQQERGQRPAAEPEDCCKECRFYHPVVKNLGQCRIRSPAPVRVEFRHADGRSESWFESQFPERPADDWCGEFDSKHPPKAFDIPMMPPRADRAQLARAGVPREVWFIIWAIVVMIAAAAYYLS